MTPAQGRPASAVPPLGRQAPYDDYDHPFFTVGQVADMLDVQQAFLRRLDQQDVVSPARSDGQQRRYSRRDIDQVTRVCSLVDDGLTLAGIKQVFALQAEVAALKAEIAELKARPQR
ncbi:MAG: MerR family transcriptional regulator [Frankiaceae bacterium]|nr:MerR family transcriptional regulator [Frankiaceae bacterium]MBV9869739.1 MerR family transcriptional regulator [Frankiaceae bacterium]